MEIKYQCYYCNEWKRQIYMSQRKIDGKWSFVCEECERKRRSWKQIYNLNQEIQALDEEIMTWSTPEG